MPDHCTSSSVCTLSYTASSFTHLQSTGQWLMTEILLLPTTPQVFASALFMMSFICICTFHFLTHVINLQSQDRTRRSIAHAGLFCINCGFRRRSNIFIFIQEVAVNQFHKSVRSWLDLSILRFNTNVLPIDMRVTNNILKNAIAQCQSSFSDAQ